jgi:hypothetical protein
VKSKFYTIENSVELGFFEPLCQLRIDLLESAQWKGPGADSEEKREPVSDVDTAAVDSLKRLTPTGRLEKRTFSSNLQKAADFFEENRNTRVLF